MMTFQFLSVENNKFPTAIKVLEQSHWKLDPDNMSFLSGEEETPSPNIRELSPNEYIIYISNRRDNEIKNQKKIVGNISDTLTRNAKIIIADTSDFNEAEIMAEKLGYRPIKAGEFLQILWFLQDKQNLNFGWFYCYYGRVENHAILASFDRQKNRISQIMFDTRYDNLNNMRANMNTKCLFVSI